MNGTVKRSWKLPHDLYAELRDEAVAAHRDVNSYVVVTLEARKKPRVKKAAQAEGITK